MFVYWSSDNTIKRIRFIVTGHAKYEDVMRMLIQNREQGILNKKSNYWGAGAKRKRAGFDAILDIGNGLFMR